MSRPCVLPNVINVPPFEKYAVDKAIVEIMALSELFLLCTRVTSKHESLIMGAWTRNSSVVSHWRASRVVVLCVGHGS